LVSKMERAPPAPSARPKDDAVMAFAAKVELDTVPESTTALTAPPTPPASTEVPVPFAYIAFPVKVDDRIEMESLIEPSFTAPPLMAAGVDDAVEEAWLSTKWLPAMVRVPLDAVIPPPSAELRPFDVLAFARLELTVERVTVSGPAA